eukprot:ctg_747.g399
MQPGHEEMVGGGAGGIAGQGNGGNGAKAPSLGRRARSGRLVCRFCGIRGGLFTGNGGYAMVVSAARTDTTTRCDSGLGSRLSSPGTFGNGAEPLVGDGGGTCAAGRAAR